MTSAQCEGPSMNRTWLCDSLVRGKLAARVGREGSTLIAEFPGAGILFVDRVRNRTAFRADPSADPAVVAKLHDGLIPALVRHAQGKMTLHAGAVAIGGGAIGFLGPAGSGKSTMMTAICRLNSAAALLADDTLAVDFSKEPAPKYFATYCRIF